MSKPRRVAPSRASLAAQRGGSRSPGLDIDWREIATGAFVVCMALVGNRWGQSLFAEARDIVETQAVFEFPMALLAVGAGQAIRQTSRAWRIVYVVAGFSAVAAAGTFTALDLGAPLAIFGGISVIVARAFPPRGCPWFSTDHCRTIEVTAGTAWACLVVGLLLFMLLAAITPSPTPGQAGRGVYAIAWGLYYLSLGLLLPSVRRRFGATPRKV